jgi:membrane-bound serine protease (ClpP class)
MKKPFFFAIVTFLILYLWGLPFGSWGIAHSAEIYEIKVNGVISPPVAGFLSDSIHEAGKSKAEALLVLLDTPGGLDVSMRAIVKSIMDAPLPVVVYVAPSGARAASAGAIILIASHVAAMAPGTNVGAAHPVNLGSEKQDKVMMEKVVQDSEAYARSLAAMRGRNAEWAAKAVTRSVSVTAEEALKAQVIDVVAPSVDDLLSKIDGKVVQVGKKPTALRTAGVKVVEHNTPLKYRLLALISDPSVAYLLMMIGFYGILFEIYSPGTIFPGVVGGMCLVLALYAFQTIPISYAGLFLILLGILFFILELKITSYGLLGIAGVTSIVIGSIMLVDLPSNWLSISWQSIFAVAIITILFFGFVLSYALKAQRSKVKTGKEGLIGEKGTAKTDLTPTGKVFVHGELWDASSDEPIAAGDRIVVIAVDDMTVKVSKEGRK